MTKQEIPDAQNTDTQETILQLTQVILKLCIDISKRRLADAMFDYSGHINGLWVSVNPVGINYAERNYPRLISQRLWLGHDPIILVHTMRGIIQTLEEISAAGQVIHVDNLIGPV